MRRSRWIVIFAAVVLQLGTDDVARAEIHQPLSIDASEVADGDVDWTLYDNTGCELPRPMPAGFAELGGVTLCGGDGSDTCCNCGSGIGCGSGVGCGTAVAGGNCLTSPHLLGDWLGARSCLTEHLIQPDVQLTQFYQGTTSGGRARADLYGGKVDYFFTIAKGLVVMHAETRFGDAISEREAGAFNFANTNMLYPLPGKHVTSITGLLVNLPLSENLVLSGGKLNSVDFWTMVYPQVGRGVEGFMNLNALSAGLPWLRYVNLSENAAGVLAMNDKKQIRGGFMVFDLNNSTTTSGVSQLFDDGAGLLGVWRFFTNVGGLPGSHLFAGGWSSREYTSLDPSDWKVIPGVGGGLIPGEASNPWTASYYWEQVVWQDRRNAERRLQLWGGLSISDGNPSFGRWGGYSTIEGYGVFPGRTQDRMGIAYFYNQLSTDFKQLVNTLPTEDLQNIHGGEFYYNYTITPSTRLTFDMQVIDTINAEDDVAILVGGRLHINL